MVNVWTLTAVKPTAGGVVLARFSQSYATLIIMHLHCGRLTAKCGKWVGGGEIKKKKKGKKEKRKKAGRESLDSGAGIITATPETRPDPSSPSRINIKCPSFVHGPNLKKGGVLPRPHGQERPGTGGIPSSDDIMLRASRQIHRGRSLRCCGGNWVASAGGAVDWERRVADWISVLFSALGRYVSINTYMHTAEVTSLYVTTSGQTTHGWAPCTGQ